MFKTLLPWLAISAILLTLFLLPKFPGKSVATLTPSNAWDHGMTILQNDEVSSERETLAEELLHSTTAFAAPKGVDQDTVAALQAMETANGPHEQELQAALLAAALEELEGQG